MRDKIEEYIIKALEEKSGRKINTTNLDSLNYWEEGYVDSMGIFLFTIELEEEYNIEFSHKDKQSEEFKTIAGLATLISNKIGDGHDTTTTNEFLNLIENYNHFDIIVKEMKESKLPILFIGVSKMGELIYPILINEGICFDAIGTGSEYFKPNKTFMGKPVYSVDNLINNYDKMSVFIGYSTFSEKDRDYYMNSGKVEKVYVCDCGQFLGNRIKYKEIEQNADKFCKVYNLLSDELSRETLLAYLNQCATADTCFLKSVYKDNQYFINEMNIGEQEEIFMDCGSYDGDTAIEFITYIENKPYDYKKIYCLECDTDNFKKLESIKSDYRDIECINKGVWNKKDVLFVSADGTSTSIGGNGDYKIEVDTIDNILKGEPITLLKMDIEGAELKALQGAEKTILKHNPRLAICVYHKKDDIYEIFEYLNKLHSYKFYMRAHMEFCTTEIVLYAVCTKIN